VLILGIALPQIIKNSYFFFAAYMIFQFIILASAWNILGGYTGYINFGTAGFFAVGAYTGSVLIIYFQAPLVVVLLIGGLLAGLLGLGLGYLTIRVRGTYFAIASLAVSVVIQVLVINTPLLGGAKGLTILRPQAFPPFSTYIEFLSALMLLLAFISVIVARTIEKSWIGKAFIAIKDSEEAAECAGVDTFHLKLFATTLSCFLMGVAGAPYPYYTTYIEPYSSMDLAITVNGIAMPIVGGIGHWLGPVIGALFLGVVQQILMVTISSELNILFLAIMIIGFLILAPRGIMGLIHEQFKLKRKGGRRDATTGNK